LFGSGIEPRGGLILVNPFTKIDQTITFDSLAVKTFNDVSFILKASATSGLAISYISSDTTVATIRDSTVTILKVGTTIITATQPGNSTYNPATSVQRKLVVNKAAQIITFNPLPNKKKGDNPFALAATSTSGLPITYKSSNPKVASIIGNVVTILKVGETTITASQSGNSSYNAAPKVKQTLRVIKKSNDDPSDDESDNDPKDCISVYPKSDHPLYNH
jgi:hypothetical protein